jgi:uncharacterized protein YjbI with pentapeptide repeats
MVRRISELQVAMRAVRGWQAGCIEGLQPSLAAPEPTMNRTAPLTVAVLAAAAVAVTVTASSARAGEFRFDEATGACRSASGAQGYNAELGACGDLRGQSLVGRSLTDLDLRGARFDGANLEGANLLRADLRGASLSQANLARAVLTGAKLTGAKLDQAQLMGAHLEHSTLSSADLRGADLRSACLYRAKFEASDLRGARFSSSKGLLEGALWTNALVDPGTVLPYSGEELSARHVAMAPAVVVSSNP